MTAPDQNMLAIEAEQGVLGSLLVRPETFLSVSGILKPEYFIEPVHVLIFQAIADCRANGRKAGISDIRQQLGGEAIQTALNGNLRVGEYLAILAREATATDAADGARALRDLWALRCIGQIANAPDRGLPETRLKAMFDDLDALRMSIEEAAVTRASAGDIGFEVLDRAAKIASGQTEEPGITTGLPELDKAMLGFRPGELVIIAGRPGMGKSTVATSLALAATDTNRPGRRGGVGFFALELGRETIGARLLADLASSSRHGPSHSAIRAGQISQEGQWELEEAANRLRHRPLIIDGRSSATVGDIEAACLAMRRTLERQGRRLDAIFIDYIKQVRATDRYRGNKVYEIGEITHGLRDIAKRLQLCVVLLVQLNRGVENRDDKRPTLADLRESGDIENDADVVILLYREAYYLRREARSEADPVKASALNDRLAQVENKLEFILAKNRNGEGEFSLEAFCDIGRSAIRPADRRYGLEISA